MLVVPDFIEALNEISVVSNIKVKIIILVKSRRIFLLNIIGKNIY